MITKRKLIFCITILLVLFPLIYAGNYGEGIYGEDIYGGNASTSSIPTSTSSPGESSSGGGGGGGGGLSCNYNWQCTNWFPSECPTSEIQERVCINRGTCTGTAEIPALNKTCAYEHKGPLFDIFLTLSDKYEKICSGEKIKAKIELENYGEIELLDAFMTYWIINENNSLIRELKDTRAVTDEKGFEIELKIPELTPEGIYRIYAQINYDTNKTAVAGRSFEVLSKENCALLYPKTFYWKYLVYGIAGILVILFVFILIKLFKRIIKLRFKLKRTKTKSHVGYKNKIKQKLKKIRAT